MDVSYLLTSLTAKLVLKAGLDVKACQDTSIFISQFPLLVVLQIYPRDSAVSPADRNLVCPNANIARR